MSEEIIKQVSRPLFGLYEEIERLRHENDHLKITHRIIAYELERYKNKKLCRENEIAIEALKMINDPGIMSATSDKGLHLLWIQNVVSDALSKLKGAE